MALTTTTGSITDLVLLGDKSYTAKKFTLKEIAGQDSPYLEGGLYKEGLQENDITFKVEYLLENFNTNTRQEISQGMIIKKDGTVVTGLTLEYHNQHLNNGNLKAPNWLFFKDTEGYKYEMCTTPYHTTTVANTKPGGCFGLPMASGATYSHAEQTIWRKENIDQPTPFYFQTNNPNVMALGFSFVIVYDSSWGSTSATRCYEAFKLSINNEEMYNHDSGTLTDSSKTFRANENYTDIRNVRWRTRYFTVQSINPDTNVIEYKNYKTWMSDDLNKIKNQGIDYKIYLKGDITGLMKEFTLEEVINKGRTDGTYNEIDNMSYVLDLYAIQKWQTINSGEILWSGAAIISEDGQTLGPYTFFRKNKVAPDTGVYELITGTYPNTAGMTSYVYIDSNRTTQTEPVAFGRQFHKSVSTYTGGNTTGKIASFLNINVTGGIDNDLIIKLYFEKPIKAFLLDTVSVYDILYNGINYASSRHTGYLKSVTHDVELFNFNTLTEWNKIWIRTINGIIYGPRTVFTPNETFIVFMKVSNQTLKVFTPTMYLYHELTDEMIEYTLDELIALYHDDRIYQGKYIYRLIPVVDIPVKIEKTFNTLDELIGYDSIQLINKDTNMVNKTYNDLGYHLFYNDDKKLFDLLSTGDDVIHTQREDGVYLLDYTKVYNNSIVNNNLRTDEPNIKRIAIIPWGSSYEGFATFTPDMCKLRVYSDTGSTATLSHVSLGLATGTEILHKDGSITKPTMRTNSSNIMTDDDGKYRVVNFSNGKNIRIYWTDGESNSNGQLISAMLNSASVEGYLPALGTKEVTYWFKGDDVSSEIEDVRLTLKASNYGYANNVEVLNRNGYVLAKLENIRKDTANTTPTWYKPGIINLNTVYKSNNTGLCTPPPNRILSRYDYHVESGTRGQVKWAFRQKAEDFPSTWNINTYDDLLVPIAMLITHGVSKIVNNTMDPKDHISSAILWIPSKYFKDNPNTQDIILFSNGTSIQWNNQYARLSYASNPIKPGLSYNVSNMITIPDEYFKLTNDEVDILWNTSKVKGYNISLSDSRVLNITKRWDTLLDYACSELNNQYNIGIFKDDIVMTQELVYYTVWENDSRYYNNNNLDMWLVSGSGYGTVLIGNSISVFTYGANIGRICTFEVSRDNRGVSSGPMKIIDDKQNVVATVTGSCPSGVVNWTNKTF